MKPSAEHFAVAGEGEACAGPMANPFGALLAKHLLRDGEIVQLMIRPSRWFILLTCLRFLSLVAILISVSVIYMHEHGRDPRRCVEIGVGIMAGRVMWAVLQWMSRLYVLTNLRILSLKGVFNPEIFDCPLRKVARVSSEASVKEKSFFVGTIVIVPQDEQMPIGTWSIISRPDDILQIIRRSVQNARQSSDRA
jgi:hypothetical protein